MKKYIGSKHSGKFSIDSGSHRYGNLTLDRRNSSLYLWDDEFFHINSPKYLFGTLHDMTKVSLMHLVTTNTGSKNRDVYFAELYPNYVLLGDKHISPEDKCISSVDFIIHDSTTLFYDFDAFGTLLEPEVFISDLINSQIKAINKYSPDSKFERSIPIGDHPIISYFTGKRIISSVDTSLGIVTILNSPNFELGDANGASIENKVVCNIEFKKMLQFDEALQRVQQVSSLFELLVGRKQELVKTTLKINSEDEEPCYLDLYNSNEKIQSTNKDWRNSPHPGDILVDAVRNPDTFNLILQKWMKSYSDKNDARNQFLEAFISEDFTTDRLVKSANMFDILPDSSFSEKKPLDSELEDARLKCRAMFKALPLSIERDGILGALGRMNNNNLKKKIRERVSIITTIAGDTFEDLSLVTDQSVDCRNYFVHGGDPKFDYYNNFQAVVFFIRTLEFVFAASELIEFGWDINKWISRGSVQAHPFGMYRVNYGVNLHNLREVIEKSVE